MPELARLHAEGRIEWRRRAFEDDDLDDVWLAFAATSDAEVQQRVADAAQGRRIFCVAVDDPARCSAYSGSVVRREPFTIAISSSGATPALTRLVREIVEAVLPAEAWVEHAKQLRARWLSDGTPMPDRFGELVRELAARHR
jgi:siroheme synthase-like protein